MCILRIVRNVIQTQLFYTPAYLIIIILSFVRSLAKVREKRGALLPPAIDGISTAISLYLFMHKYHENVNNEFHTRVTTKCFKLILPSHLLSSVKFGYCLRHFSGTYIHNNIRVIRVLLVCAQHDKKGVGNGRYSIQNVCGRIRYGFCIVHGCMPTIGVRPKVQFTCI